MAADELERGRQEVGGGGSGGSGEEVYAKEGEEDVRGRRVRIVDALAVLFCLGEIPKTVNVDFERAVVSTESAEEDRLRFE